MPMTLDTGRLEMRKADEKTLFESGSIRDIMVKLALPTVLGQMITVIYNMADTFFVGMLSDDAKMTAVTVAMPCFMILSAISNLFGIGGASAISRAMGSGDRERAENEASFSFWGALVSGSIYIILVAIFVHPLVDILGGSNPIVHIYTVSYILTAVCAGGIMTVMGAFFSHLLRSEGRGFEASFGIVLGGILNIILDPIFMFFVMPEGMEVAGAAAATAISNMVSMVYFALVIFKRRSESVISISPRKAIAGIKNQKDILSSGLPAFCMTLCENVSYAVLDSLMAGFGITVQAGVGVAKKINMLAHSIVRGMSQGMLPMIAYSYASGNRERMKKASRASSMFSVLSALICMAVSLIFADGLADIFLEAGSESAMHAARILRIFALGAPFSAFAYTSISFFQATGHGGRSLSLALMRKGILDIPLMFILVRLFGAYGAAAGTPIADGICAVAASFMMVSFMKRECGFKYRDKSIEHVQNRNRVEKDMPMTAKAVI